MADSDDRADVFKLVLTGNGVQVDQKVDRRTAMKVIEVAMGGEPSAGSSKARSTKRKRPSEKANGAAKPPRRKRRGSPGIVKDLSMRPSGKQTFSDFAGEKKPKTHMEKQAVILYWLHQEAGIETGITLDHVNTCYQAISWKRPTDLENSLRVTSMEKGWLDTSDGSDIKLTVPGEDFVRHELPPKEE